MYHFLDRPVASLATADHLLLDGLRAWALARALNRDTLGAVAARAAPLGETGAAEALDDAMTLLDDAGTGPLMLQRPCHGTVEEDEAVLLAIARLAQAGSLDAATAAEDDGVSIRDIRFGPFGSPVFDRNGDQDEGVQRIMAVVCGKFWADPNPVRPAPPAAVGPARRR